MNAILVFAVLAFLAFLPRIICVIRENLEKRNNRRKLINIVGKKAYEETERLIKIHGDNLD